MKSSAYIAAAFVIGAGLSFAGTLLMPLATAKTSENIYCDRIDTIDRYACLIDMAGHGAAGQVEKNRSAYTILAAVQTIQAIASSARYSYLLATAGDFTKPTVTEQVICLDEAFGICGNHMLLFTALMDRLGIPSHKVEFYYQDPATGQRSSHATAEALVDGKWRFVDVTWGSVWLADEADPSSMLSLDEVRAGQGMRQTAQIDPWFIASRVAGTDPFAYLSTDADVIVGGDGMLRLPLGKDGEADFSNVPNYVGDSTDDGANQRVAFQINFAGAEKRGLEMVVSGFAGCAEGHLEVGGQTMRIVEGKMIVKGVSAGDTVRVVGDDLLCYVVFSAITLL